MSTTGPEQWRIVLLTDFGGQIVTGFERIFTGLGHKLVGVVTSPGPRGLGLGRHLDVVTAAPRGVDVLVSNHPKRWAAMLAPLRPDLLVSAVFPWIIPDDLIALPRVAAINLHGSLLPRWRGPNPLGWAIRSGDTEFGFTVHRLDSGLDTGPILAQSRVPLTVDDDFDSLAQQLLPTFPQLFATAFQRIAAGDMGDPQDESQATYAGLFDETYRALDWSRPALEVHNQVRAWMSGLRGMTRGAVGIVDGVPLRILKARFVASDGTAAPAGTIVSRDAEGFVIQCGDGQLAVLRAEPVEEG